MSTLSLSLLISASIASFTFAKVNSPICTTSCIAVSTANAGDSSIRLSRCCIVSSRSAFSSLSFFSSASSLTIIPESFTSCLEKGKRINVLVILKNVWKMDISTAFIVPRAISLYILKKIKPPTANITAPKELNKRCITAALLAILLLPILDISAVIQVPIF